LIVLVTRLIISNRPVSNSSYQFVIVGQMFVAVSVGKEQQLAVAVEGEVHVELVLYAGQVVGQK
jgi:hypothetical protein